MGTSSINIDDLETNGELSRQQASSEATPFPEKPVDVISPPESEPSTKVCLAVDNRHIEDTS